MPHYPESTLDGLLSAAASSDADRPAVIAPAQSVSFGVLNARAGRWAAVVRDVLGLEHGSVIAVSSVLDPCFAVCYYGTLRAGSIAAVLNPHLPPQTVVRMLSTVRAQAAVVTADMARHLQDVAGELPELRHLVLSEPKADGPLPTVDELTAVVDPAGDDEHFFTAAPDDVACVQFTSGTTGTAKAVMLSHRNLTANALQTAWAHGLSPEAVMANHLPAYHPMHLNSAVSAGATQVLCTTPDPVAALETAARHGATHFYSLPTRLTRLADDSRIQTLRVPTLQVIASGAAPLPPSAAVALGTRLGVPVVQGYGLTEASPLTHSDNPSAPKAGSVGRPVGDTECRVVDLSTRRILGPDAAGEVQVRGPQVMRGYLGGDQGTGVGPDGWLDTGDVGRIDAEGALFLLGRTEDVFTREGHLVSPAAVEGVLAERPEVQDCCVVGVPDAAGTPAAHALIVPSAAQPSDTGLRDAVAAANRQLLRHCHIQDFDIVPEIPRSVTGKVSRAEARSRVLHRLRDRTAPPEVPSMVTMVNKFVVHGDCAEFEKVWLDSAHFMRNQPGFVGFRLVRSLDDPKVYINIAEWTDAESHRRVIRGAEFQAHIGELARVARPEPHLCEAVVEHGAL